MCSAGYVKSFSPDVPQIHLPKADHIRLFVSPLEGKHVYLYRNGRESREMLPLWKGPERQ